MNERTKSRFEVVVTSYGLNKNRDCEKNQEKANNSPSYRCADINKHVYIQSYLDKNENKIDTWYKKPFFSEQKSEK